MKKWALKKKKKGQKPTFVMLVKQIGYKIVNIQCNNHDPNANITNTHIPDLKNWKENYTKILLVAISEL